MSNRLIFRAFLWCCTALALASCGGGDPLTYDVAMDLMRDRMDVVRISFSASPRFTKDDVKLATAYQKLLDGKVIQCKSSSALGVLCEPGPAGDALKQDSATELSLVARRWAPSAILSVRRTGRSSASADVRMVFEPSPTLRDFGDALDMIQPPGFLLAQSTWKQGKVVHATFQRFEDGWHVDTVTD